jgi:hypothetical protein
LEDAVVEQVVNGIVPLGVPVQHLLAGELLCSCWEPVLVADILQRSWLGRRDAMWLGVLFQVFGPNQDLSFGNLCLQRGHELWV